MNRRLRLCIIAACTLMAGMIQASIPAPGSVEVRLRKIGEYFCQQVIAGTVGKLKDSRNVPDVVRVGQDLPGVLAGMRPALLQGYTIEVQEGGTGKNEG